MTSDVEFPGVVDEFYPVNGTLSAKYKKAFGYVTIRTRLPIILAGIAKQVLDDALELSKQHGEEALLASQQVHHQLEELRNEILTNSPIKTTTCPVWAAYGTAVAAQFCGGDASLDTWITGPFLHNECYMYHRMQEAFNSSPFHLTYDPFRHQKENGYFQSVGPMEALLDWLDTVDPHAPEALQTLLEVALWGNRCDLSISQGADNSQKTDVVVQLADLRSKVLADDSEKFWSNLNSIKCKGTSGTLGYILDNVGFEVFSDLCLAEALIGAGLVTSVTFYVKVQPWFVSDVMTKDFHWLLQQLKKEETRPRLKQAGEKWDQLVKDSRFIVVEHPFWTYPHTFNEMKTADPDLYQTLAGHSFLIFKGDLNYRKLMGEINRDYDTPFEDALQGFHPAPSSRSGPIRLICVQDCPRAWGRSLAGSTTNG